MDFQKLVEAREKAIAIEEKEKFINININRYEENTFKLRIPDNVEVLNLFQEKFKLKEYDEESIAKITKELSKNYEKTIKYINEFIFTLFVDPNLAELNSEILTLDTNIKSKSDTVSYFFNNQEITEIFILVIQKFADKIMNTATAIKEVEDIKKK